VHPLQLVGPTGVTTLAQRDDGDGTTTVTA